MIRAVIHTENLFAQVTERVEELAAECVQIGADTAAEVAKQVGAANHATEIEVIPAHATGEGYSAGIKSPWFYRFLSYGTLGNAIRPKRPGHIRSRAAGTGIKPNRMFQQARLAGRRAMQERARRGLL